MKLKLIKNNDLNDWYTIEKAEHNHTHWARRIADHTLKLFWSGRISDADVEGNAEEMLTIAKAIYNRSYVEFKRCAVECFDNDVHFWSPRNSTEDGIVSYEEALDLARQIYEECDK